MAATSGPNSGRPSFARHSRATPPPYRPPWVRDRVRGDGRTKLLNPFGSEAARGGPNPRGRCFAFAVAASAEARAFDICASVGGFCHERASQIRHVIVKDLARAAQAAQRAAGLVSLVTSIYLIVVIMFVAIDTLIPSSTSMTPITNSTTITVFRLLRLLLVLLLLLLFTIITLCYD